MSSRHSRLAGRQRAIPKIPAQAESCLPPARLALPSEPASGHKTEHSRPRWCHCQPRPSLPPSLRRDGAGAGRGGTAAKGEVAAENTGNKKQKNPGRACGGRSRPSVDTRPIPHAVLGAGEKSVRGSWLQTTTRHPGRQSSRGGGRPVQQDLPPGQECSRPAMSRWPSPTGPRWTESTCKGTGVGQDCADHLSPCHFDSCKPRESRVAGGHQACQARPGSEH